jgi:hypothetical protein
VSIIQSLKRNSQALVAHAHNPRYSGGGDQEDGSSKPAPGKQFKTLSQKCPTQQKDWWNDLSGRAPA